MPVQSTKSKLLSKFGTTLDAAVKAASTNETNYGFMQLPGGIKQGKARLSKCYFDEYKSGDLKGQVYFRAEGVVVSPKEIDTPQGKVVTAGMTTSIMVPCCDTKKTVDGKQVVVSVQEHLDTIMNEMRKLGVNTKGFTMANFEPAAAALVKAAPYFRFSTNESAEVKNPDGTVKFQAKVWERWYGTKGLENYDPEQETEGPEGSDGVGGMVDGTRPGAAPSTPATSENANPENIPDVTGGEEGDVDSVLEGAKNNDVSAQEQLSKMALAAGATQEQVDGAADWDAVAELARGTASGESTDEGGTTEPSDWKPSKGEMYYFKPIDPKTKKPFVDPKTKKPRKAVECEVTAVDEKAKSVTLKNSIDGKTIYKGVSWDDLSGEQ